MARAKIGIIRLSISGFCIARNMTKVDLATSLGISKQQINNCINAEVDFYIDCDPKTNQVMLVRGEKVVHQFKMKKAAKQ